MTNLVQNYIGISAICIVVLFVLTSIISKNVFFNDTMKTCFLLAISAVIIVIGAELGTVVLGTFGPEFRTLNIICNIVGFGCSPIIPVFLGMMFCNKNTKVKSIFFIPVVINLIFSVLSPWAGLIFSVTENNEYSRGSFFIVYIISYLIGMVMLLIETYKVIKHYQNRTNRIFSILFVFFIVGTGTQVFFPDIHTTWLCVTFCIVMYYAYISELEETTDALTGLLNRQAYEYEKTRMKELKHSILVIFDIDNFKSVNDRYGHQIGDQCLIIIADCVRKAFNDIGICYRIGGDEFCVICRTKNTTIIENKIEEFQGLMSREIEKMKEIPTVSSGYGVYIKSETSVEKAFYEADKKMYAEKERKKIKRGELYDGIN